MGASLDAPLQVVQQPQSLGDDQVPGLDGLDMDAYDHNDGFLASNSDDSNDDDNGDDRARLQTGGTHARAVHEVVRGVYV
eukprot:COSAG02_NODE_10267_length_1982_cov_2.556028_3_plen_80_part_00